jgi:Flp pilus assembly protein TadD
MNTRMLVSIGLATAMLGGSLAMVATGSVAVASSETSQALKFATRATAALTKRKPMLAVQFAEQAVVLESQNASYRALLGRAYLAAGRFASATQAFTDVLALDPADGRAALNLALAQTATGEWVAARQTLEAHAARIAPGDRGLALALAGDPASGMALLAEAARDPAATATVRQNLALVLALNGRWVEARAVASVDMSPALVDQRLVEWAAFARPDHAAQQVASLLGVTPAEDRGQPVQLALNAANPVLPVALASSDPAPVVDPVADGPAVPVAVEMAAVSVPRPAISFAPRREIVQALPAQYARAATVRPTTARREMAGVTSPAPTRGSYFVQIGAYENAGVARAAWQRVSRRVPQLAALSPRGMRASVGGNDFYRLSVGGFARADAASLCSKLHAQGNRCFVRLHAGERLAAWARGTQMAAR